MKSFKFLTLCGTALVLTACASTPMGPTVRALPGKNKSFDQFQFDQATCKQYADDQTRGQAERANQTGFLEGAGGTILGAGLGAAIGGGRGAAIGAASGAVAGTAVGAHTSSQVQGGIQQQYNDAYVACMVSKKNLVERPTVYSQPQAIVVQQPAPPPTVVYTQPAAPQPPQYYGH
jgi:hypothetical protein